MNRLAITVLAGVIIAVVGVLLGAWWMPFLVGAAFGITVERARWAVPLGGASGLLAWLLPLVVDQVRYGVGPTAGSLAAIMGFGHRGALPVILTLLVGTLLGLSGAWLAGGARLLISPASR